VRAFSLRALRETLGDLPRRFWEASPAKKAALVGAGLLTLAALVALVGLLSPILAVAAVLVFGASLVGLIVRAGQRRAGQRASLWGWGITSAASFVLVIALVGVSGALYGTDSSTRSGQDASSASTPEDATSEAGQYVTVPGQYTPSDVQTECRPMEHYTGTVPASTPGYIAATDYAHTMRNGASLLQVNVLVHPSEEEYMYVTDEFIAGYDLDEHDAIEVHVQAGDAYAGSVVAAYTDRGAAATGLATNYDGDTGACKYALGF